MAAGALRLPRLSVGTDDEGVAAATQRWAYARGACWNQSCGCCRWVVPGAAAASMPKVARRHHYGALRRPCRRCSGDPCPISTPRIARAPWHLMASDAMTQMSLRRREQERYFQAAGDTTPPGDPTDAAACALDARGAADYETSAPSRHGGCVPSSGYARHPRPDRRSDRPCLPTQIRTVVFAVSAGRPCDVHPWWEPDTIAFWISLAASTHLSFR